MSHKHLPPFPASRSGGSGVRVECGGPCGRPLYSFLLGHISGMLRANTIDLPGLEILL